MTFNSGAGAGCLGYLLTDVPGALREGSRTREQPLYSNTGPIGSDLSHIGPERGTPRRPKIALRLLSMTCDTLDDVAPRLDDVASLVDVAQIAHGRIGPHSPRNPKRRVISDGELARDGIGRSCAFRRNTTPWVEAAGDGLPRALWRRLTAASNDPLGRLAALGRDGIGSSR
jgi:hypothetical protein